MAQNLCQELFFNNPVFFIGLANQLLNSFFDCLATGYEYGNLEPVPKS